MFSHKYPEVILGLRIKERKERGAVDHPSPFHLLPLLVLCPQSDARAKIIV